MRIPFRLIFASTFLFTLAPAVAAEPKVIAIIGPPGSGQSTQARALNGALRLPVVSAEELIHAEFGRDSEEAKQLRSSFEIGVLQRIDAVNDMIRRRLEKGGLRTGFIVDGYPRTRSQAEFFEKLLVSMKLPVLEVVVLEVPDGELTRRLQKARPTEAPGSLRERVAAFRAEADVLAAYFGTRLKRVNGQQAPAAVTAEILRLLKVKP